MVCKFSKIKEISQRFGLQAFDILNLHKILVRMVYNMFMKEFNYRFTVYSTRLCSTILKKNKVDKIKNLGKTDFWWNYLQLIFCNFLTHLPKFAFLVSGGVLAINSKHFREHLEISYENFYKNSVQENFPFTLRFF